MVFWIALIISALLTSHASAQPDVTATNTSPEKVSAEDAFAELTRMVGTWRRADKPESPLRIASI